MSRIFLDDDARIEHLDGKKIVVFGYGNQGRSQALNFRDSGVTVVIANREDERAETARHDGFEVIGFGAAADQADVLLFLLPDEIQNEVYHAHVAARLKRGATLCFAHGYNIRYGLLSPPSWVDVVLVAPRMIGAAVRDLFVSGSGAPAFVAVEQDVTGTAWQTTLALAKALGATRVGAIETTFAEETELDLFSEQLVWPVILRLFLDAYTTLVDQGYNPDAVLMELYGSGEPARVLAKTASVGLFRQGALHSQTSQFGTLSRMERIPEDFVSRLASVALDEIRSGTFSTEWQEDAESGFPRLTALRQSARRHPINAAEDRLHETLNASIS